ncbi:protein alp1-like, partial [Plakobranchus ocellatus]
IVCNADLLIMDCVARHPGRAHDARVLRESALFAGMERQPPLVNGLILGDSGYPIRDWLITPFGQPANVQEERLNLAHRETRVTVERCIGVLKRRFYCLHMELCVEPHVASRIVYACCMLHNRATQLGLEAPEDDQAPPAGNIPLPNPGVPNVAGETARTAAGKAMRLHIAKTHFH